MSARSGSALFVALLLFLGEAWAQDIEAQLPGVVKITSTADGTRRVGSGVVVKLDAGAAYILTVAHVIEGDRNPKVEFYSRRGRLVPARPVHAERGQDKGLALLLVEGESNVPADVVALRLAETMTGRAPESVSAIGFPGGDDWQVINVNIAGRAGTDITLSSGLSEGNSGGPVINKDGTVIGVVTTVKQLGYATPAAVARFYLDGNGVTLSAPVTSNASALDTGAPVRLAPDWSTAASEVRSIGGVDFYEVDFTQGLTADAVCGLVDKVPGDFTSDPKVCQAFHPSAGIRVSLSGDNAVTFCSGLERGVCREYKNTCLVCPNCIRGVGVGEWGGGLYSKMYTTCVIPR